MTRSVLVKICGTRTLAAAQAAVDAGADLLGFICYPPARRYLPPEQIASLLSRLQGRAAVQAVGVFVNQPVEEMNAVADACGLDLIQLSGDEPDVMLGRLARPVIRAVRVAGGRRGGLRPTVQTGEAGSSRPTTARPQGGRRDRLFALLLEPPSAGWGGSGVRVDWSQAHAFTELADRPPVFLAGGLTPENVAGAIALVRPDGVDVSSGVERDGAQDSDRIAAFVVAAKGAVR